VSQYADILDSELQAFQLQIPTPQRQQLVQYCDELDRWNKKINLTGLKGHDLVRRLVVEPVWSAQELQLSGTLADIGSGNGSPAIPMHIVRDLERCELIEVRAKRVAFLRHISANLRLSAVTVHHSRFEEAARNLEKVDWITLQAVALTGQILDSIRQISLPTTTIVWITSGTHPPVEPFRRVLVPVTGSEVLLFRLDQS
jgi:16S rRNA (guanine527-N7)-methyltransferase